MGFLSSLSTLQGTVLVVVIAWALGAVLMLTSTIVSANQIDRRVDVITSEVKGIDADTDAVELAGSVAETAEGIDAAAAPLSGQLDEVIAATEGINASAASILETAGSIGATVDSIRSTVGSINSTVDDIHANVGGILPVTQSIDAGVEAINHRADRIIAAVRAIKADTGNTLAQVLEIHTHANSINCSPAVQGAGVVGGGGACDSHPHDG